MAPRHLAKQNDPDTHYNLCQQEANYAPILPQSTPRHDAEHQNSHSNPYAAATRGPVPKIGCKDVAKCTHAALAPLRLGFFAYFRARARREFGFKLFNFRAQSGIPYTIVREAVRRFVDGALLLTQFLDEDIHAEAKAPASRPLDRPDAAHSLPATGALGALERDTPTEMMCAGQGR